MRLKIKKLEFSAGRPIAMLNQQVAENLNIHVDERVVISHNSKKVIAVIDVSKNFIKNSEIAASSEVLETLNIQEGVSVDVDPAPKPESIAIIKKKLDGKVLEKKEINLLIKDIVDNALTEAEIAYFVSSVYKCGMNMQETFDLTDAIYKSGKKLELKGKVVDKHSIGGIPGNRTTPIVTSICASSGLIMPKTSSRAITTSAGTADTMETICKVDFTIPEIKKIIEKTQACLVWGGSLGLAPADDKIIQVERLLNVDPEAQLLASIISKKLASGAKYILIDIPYGKTAKVNKEQAEDLKKKFEYLGKSFNLKMKVILTPGNEPIGNGIGPSLEMNDIISVLNQDENRPLDLEEKSLYLASIILELSGKAEKGKGIILAREILKSGKAFLKFKEIIEAQSGKIRKLEPAKLRKDIKAESDCIILEIDNKKINYLARLCGAPVDKSAGLYLWKHTREKINKGENILSLYSDSEDKLKQALEFYRDNQIIKTKGL
jgi:AMP phosphorylase